MMVRDLSEPLPSLFCLISVVMIFACVGFNRGISDMRSLNQDPIGLQSRILRGKVSDGKFLVGIPYSGLYK